MLTALRRVAKAGLHALTRWSHPWRRGRTARALAGRPRPGSVLFICLGNVCRSPYAEVAFRHLAPEVDADSAGFIGPGRAAPDLARDVARERGLDLSSHVSKVVTADLARGHDLIVVMEPGQRRKLRRMLGATATVVALGDLDPVPPDRRSIPDPWGKDADVFRSSFSRIDRCLAELRARLDGAHRGA